MDSDGLSAEEKEFLQQCEEEFKDRFTKNDEEFMKVFNREPSIPPILENWWSSSGSGRRNDRRFNNRFQPYERHGNRDRRGRGDYNRHGRSHYDHRGHNDNRGYNENRDNDNRGYHDRYHNNDGYHQSR